jgi:hypothetical protein
LKARARATAQWLVEGLNPSHHKVALDGYRFIFGREGVEAKQIPFEDDDQNVTAKAMARGEDLVEK